MVKINNTFKACALFAGVLYLLYGGKLVNEWRGSRRGSGWEEAPFATEEFATVGGFGGQKFGGGGQGY